MPETLGDLQGLAEKGRGGDLGKPHMGGHLQGKAHVIPHLDKGLLGQFGEERLEVPLAFAPGAEADVLKPRGPGHPQAGGDGGPVGLVGKRLHQPGGAQNRDAPHDPQAGVEGVPGQFLPPGHEDFHPQPQGLPGADLIPHLAQGPADHPPGHRVDGGLPHRHRQTRLGHPAHAVAAQKGDFLPGSRGFQAPDPGPDLRPVGDVGVIAGILDHHRLPPGAVPAVAVERDAEAPPAGQGHLDPIRAGPGQKFVQRPLGRGRGGGAGGKPLAQFLPGPGRPEGLVVLRGRMGMGVFFTTALLTVLYLAWHHTLAFRKQVIGIAWEGVR